MVGEGLMRCEMAGDGAASQLQFGFMCERVQSQGR